MQRLVLLGAALVLGAISSCPAAAAQQFVAELDPSPPIPISSAPRNPTGDLQGWFTASVDVLDLGLYATDGTLAGTRRVLDGGVTPIDEFAGRLLFRSGLELWCTDGTLAGTVRLLPSTGEVQLLGSVGGRLVFTDRDPLFGLRIWGTDLTAAGTSLITVYNSLPFPFAVNLGSELLLFGSHPGQLGYSVNATDGFTLSFRALLPTSNDFGQFARNAVVLGGNAYFLTRFSTGTGLLDELWRTDGMTASAVTALGPNTNRYLGLAGGKLVITGDALTTTTLESDGTAAGTVVMTNRVRATRFATIGNLAFCVGQDAAADLELWRTDGTDAGTVRLIDATPGSTPTSYSQLLPGQTKLFALADNLRRVIVSDGTVAGTTIVPQQVLLPQNSGGFGVFADSALVTATVGGNPQMFATDGTAAGTVQLTGSAVRPGITGPFSGAPLLGDLCFVARDTVHGRELWRTDGTAAGTALVEDLVTGSADGVSQVVPRDGQLWFTAGGRLFRSDGTAAGRTLVIDTGSAFLESLQAGPRVVSFLQPTSTFSRQLWRTDGVTTTPLPLSLSHTAQVLQVDDATWFVNVFGGGHLFRWDGQPAGGIDLGPADRILGRIGSRVVFSMGSSLLVSDGTVAGTAPLGTMPAQAALSSSNRRGGGSFVVVVDTAGGVHATDGASVVTLPMTTPGTRTVIAGGDDHVCVGTHDGNLGALWSTDGTIAGSALLLQPGILPNARVLGIWPLGSGNRLLLSVQGDTGGAEPWITDGTPIGTVQLGDLNPNGSSAPELLGVAGTVAYFAADDGVHGPELWRLDLPAVGAASVQSLGSGCPGTFGDPLLASTDTPEIGAPFTANLTQAMPNSLAIWLLATDLGQLAVGGGCTLYFQNLYSALWNLTDGAGRSSLQLQIPNSPLLIGLPLIEQVGVFDPAGASPFGTSTTAGLLLVVGG